LNAPDDTVITRQPRNNAKTTTGGLVLPLLLLARTGARTEMQTDDCVVVRRNLRSHHLPGLSRTRWWQKGRDKHGLCRSDLIRR
jgi:hypothetical protein